MVFYPKHLALIPFLSFVTSTVAALPVVAQPCEKRGVTLMVGESYIFMTSIMKARELIDAGEIGKPQQIRQRFGAWIERAGALDDGREVTPTRCAAGAWIPRRPAARASLGCSTTACISSPRPSI
jgi:hypothetical protein